MEQQSLQERIRNIRISPICRNLSPTAQRRLADLEDAAEAFGNISNADTLIVAMAAAQRMAIIDEVHQITGVRP